MYLCPPVGELLSINNQCVHVIHIAVTVLSVAS